MAVDGKRIFHRSAQIFTDDAALFYHIGHREDLNSLKIF